MKINLLNKKTFFQSAEEVTQQDLANVKSCLILAPHPDDESLGCGGLIALLTSQNVNISVVVTTDGSRSHKHSVKFSAEKLANLRKGEIKNALHILGVKSEHIHFLNGKDSALPARGEEGFEALLEKLNEVLSTLKPDMVLVPYELDPHRDHRATWQLLNEALKSTSNIRVWEYPIWLYELAKAHDIPDLKAGELKKLNINPFLDKKIAAINSHLSQTTRLIDDDPTGFMLLPEVIKHFTTDFEYFFERTMKKNSATLNEDYFDKVYAENPDPWNFEKSEYERKKYEKTMESLPGERYSAALEIGCSIGVLTKMLAMRCDQLLSIDINDAALKSAEKRLENTTNVTLKKGTIPNDLPSGHFDLIVMSEVGYYLSIQDLKKSKDLIKRRLKENGDLVLVHWTHDVPDYPLSGDQVNETFLADEDFKVVNQYRTEDYRLEVLRKK